MRYLGLFLLLFGLEIHAKDLHLLGVNSRGKLIRSKISSENYKKQLAFSLQKAQESIPSQQIPFLLPFKGVIVGLGVKGEIGLGPFSLGAGIRQRFYFTR
jgi:hypothetical protein